MLARPETGGLRLALIPKELRVNPANLEWPRRGIKGSQRSWLAVDLTRLGMRPELAAVWPFCTLSLEPCGVWCVGRLLLDAVSLASSEWSSPSSRSVSLAAFSVTCWYGVSGVYLAPFEYAEDQGKPSLPFLRFPS